MMKKHNMFLDIIHHDSHHLCFGFYEKGVIARFEEGSITLNSGFKINLGIVFELINFARRDDEGNWLDTTYISDNVRIGR